MVIGSGLVCAIVAASCLCHPAKKHVNLSIEKTIENVIIAIKNKNNDEILKYVHKDGTYFVDSKFEYSYIKNSMKNKNSWLYKHLYVGNKSIHNFFAKEKNLKIKIHYYDENSVHVAFETSNNKSIDWTECCFFRIDGKWYFSGIFYCG